MPDMKNDYNPSDPYFISGELLNEIARRLNAMGLLNFSAGDESNSSLGGRVAGTDSTTQKQGVFGMVELVTNDPNKVYNNGSTPTNINGTDARGNPFSRWYAGFWYVRFIHLDNQLLPTLDSFPVNVYSGMYAFSDRANSGLSEGGYGDQNSQGGSVPLFAPGDKFPALYYPESGYLIPILSPPEEVPFFEWGSGSQPAGIEILPSGDLGGTDQICCRIEWYDPDDQSWYYYPDRIIRIPKGIFADGEAGYTTSIPMSILMKDRMVFRLTVAKSIDANDRVYLIDHWSVSIKSLGRHWHSSFLFQGNNRFILYDNDRSRDDDFNKYVVGSPWVTVQGSLPIANTKRRWGDMPECVGVGTTTAGIGIAKPANVKWNWTGELLLSVKIEASSKDVSSGSSTSGGLTSGSSASSTSYSIPTSSSSTDLSSSSSQTNSTSSMSNSTSSTYLYSTSSTQGKTTSSTQAMTTSSTQGRTTSSTQLDTSTQAMTTSSTQAMTTSSTIRFTTSSTYQESTSHSSSTENITCVTVVTDIHCNPDGTIAEVCKTRICWPSWLVKVYPEVCSPCPGGPGDESSSSTSGGQTSASSASSNSVSTLSSVSSSKSTSTSTSQSASSDSLPTPA